MSKEVPPVPDQRLVCPSVSPGFAGIESLWVIVVLASTWVH